MKKKALSLLLCAVLMLTACTAPPAETTAPPTTQAPTEASATIETTTAPAELIRYPLNADSTYVNLARELPSHIYTTTGSKNGLCGTVYTFSGTVTDYSTTPMDVSAVEQVFVETEGGTVMIANFYKWLYNSAYIEFGETAANAVYPYRVTDYQLPAVGETAEFVAIYVGYSGGAKVPMFYLGANPALFELEGYPDPAAAALNKKAVSVNGKDLIVGNMRMEIPSGYTAQIVNDNAIMLGSPDGKCGISVFAADISDLDEATATYYVPMQRESFFQKDVVRTEPESIGMYTVAGFDVDMIYYGEMDADDYSTQSCLDTTFTDSWYCYTILLRTTAEDSSDYVSTYGEMLLTAEYTGSSPRFDFVQ